MVHSLRCVQVVEERQLTHPLARLEDHSQGGARFRRIPVILAAAAIGIATSVWSVQQADARQLSTRRLHQIQVPVGLVVAAAEKDLWDKLESISGIVAGIAVAIIGGIATYLYNRRQQESDKLQRAQDRTITRIKTVGEFFPNLASGDDRLREATFVAVGALDPELAAKLSAIWRDAGGIGALVKLATSPHREVAEEAVDVLRAITDQLRESVVKIIVRLTDDPFGYESTGFSIGPGQRLVVPKSVLPGSKSEESFHITARTFDQNEVEARLIQRPAESFIAVLESAVPVPALSLGSTDDLRRGDALQTLFYTREFPGGTIATCRFDGIEDGLLRISGLMSGPGSSGAPLVDRSGRVVGTHVKRIEPGGNITMAVSAEAIAEALSLSGD